MKKGLIILISLIIFTSPCYSFDRKGFSPTSPFSIFSTFSTDTPNQNQVAADFLFDLVREPEIRRLNLNLSYGLTDKIEIIMGIPYVFRYSNFTDEQGFEEFNLGFKHRVIDETKILPAFAYILYLSKQIESSDFPSDGGWGAGLIASKKIGPVRAHGNLIYFNPNEKSLKNTWYLNLGADLMLSHNSKMLFEVIGRKAIDKNKIDLIEWRIGYRIRVTDFSYTTVGVGFDIKNRNPDMRFLFGISFILPKEKNRVKKIVEDVH